MRDDVLAAVRSAATAELSWTEDAMPAARAVVPLASEDGPILAVPYAHAAWARSVATRPRVVMTLTDRRLCGTAWCPLRLTAVPHLVEDREGTLFSRALLDQELRKHPPSRALADSPILRREHWWYLPRLLVHLDVVTADDVPERAGPDDVLLVTARPGAVHEPTVRVVHMSPAATRVRLTPLDGEELADVGDALLFGHDFTCPDLERWVSWVAAGPLRSGALEANLPGERVAADMPRLRERMRRQRDMNRGCLRGLREAQ